MGTLYNAKLSKEFFPDWEFRVYHEDGINPEYLKNLQDLGTNTINIGMTEIVGSLWRFLVYDDPTVDYFICRDVDDRLNKHDAELVDLWLESELPFHIIRAHPGHRNEMMAGMWGGKACFFENYSIRQDLQNFDYKDRQKNSDQRFLMLNFYPKIKDISLVHGYDFFGAKNVQKFPKVILNHQNQEVYPIGEVYDENTSRSIFD
jgi:hypothetical protein